jgi:hypothetical protein
MADVENGAATAAPKPKASETTREYIVLTPTGGGLETGGKPAWAIVGQPTASTDAEARKIVGQSLPEDERDAPLVAVPVRYWQPKKRKVTTKISESWD